MHLLLCCMQPFYTRLNSLRLCLRMVSLTATKTKRMFSVSVAQVKWEYNVLSLSCSWYIFRMNFWAATWSCWGPAIQGWYYLNMSVNSTYAHQTLDWVDLFNCLLMQIYNLSITWRQFSALRHADMVKMSHWSSNQASPCEQQFSSWEWLVRTKC